MTSYYSYQQINENVEEFGEKLINFLDVIHGENTYEIRFIQVEKYNGKPISFLKHQNYIYKVNREGEMEKVYEATAKNLVKYLNECLLHAGHTGVFFTVNSPNFEIMESCYATNKHITNGGMINCQFVDIDAPKELRSNKEQLQSWKMGVKAQILSFPLRPSIVVETKNGYHVYWLLDNGKSNMFKYIQMQLVQFFEGDIKSINESRVLRLPYFQHLKDLDDKYIVRLKIMNSKRYTQEELKSALPKLEEDTFEKIGSKSFSEPLTISGAKKEDVLELFHNRVQEYCVKADSKQIRMHCIMPDHEDRNPSAWFDKDFMWYHCAGCGCSYPILELAKEFEWKEIVEAWDKYDIDIHSEIENIKEQMIDVNDLEHLSLNSLEQEQVDNIADKVVGELCSWGQDINSKHQQYIHEIVQILFKANKEKPYLIPLDMGGGKSLIIKIFLQEMIKENPNFGAVVAVQRIEDVKRISEELNSATGLPVVFPMYGFDKEECLPNKEMGKNYSACIDRKGQRCSMASKCRLYNQAQDQQYYPIIIMTLKRLSLRSESLDDYNYFLRDGQEIKRELLIIDEKPELTYVKTLNYKGFKTFTTMILKEIESKSIDGDLAIYDEFMKVVELIEPNYTFEVKGRDIIEPLKTEFSFSKDFWKRFYSIYDYTDEAFEIPKILESIVKNGGHLDAVNEEKILITTSFYHLYSKFKDFKTVIFDGTADIDVEYQHSKYYLFNFEPIRTYEGLTIHQCNLVSGTKTSMRNEEKLKAFCEEVKKIANENPHERTFVPVFKDNKSDVMQYLEEYIDSGQIITAHFGSTRGSNEYKNCSIVIIGGILHKTEHYYIGKAQALYKEREIVLDDIYCSNYGKARRFNDTNIELVKILDMLVDYSQEIKRSKQRDNSKNVKGDVYIFHNDNILLDLIGLKFPGSEIEEWMPEKMIKSQVFSKTNNKNVQAVYEYIEKNSHKEEIPFAEIIEATGLKKTQFSDIMRTNEIIQALYTEKGYVVEKCEHDKRSKKLVKK